MFLSKYNIKHIEIIETLILKDAQLPFAFTRPDLVQD